MAVDFQTILSSPDATYAEGVRFFRGKGMLNKALLKIAADLDREEIDYVAIGAIALNRHGYRRFTEDIDLLLTRDGLEVFRERLIGRGYRPAFESATKKFRTTDKVPIEIITSGEYPGDGLPKPVVFPDPADHVVVIGGVKTIWLEKMIELKKQYAEAVKHYLNVIDIYAGYNNPAGTVATMEDLAALYLKMGERQKSADTYRTIASIHKNFKHAKHAREFRDRAEQVEQGGA